VEFTHDIFRATNTEVLNPCDLKYEKLKIKKTVIEIFFIEFYFLPIKIQDILSKTNFSFTLPFKFVIQPVVHVVKIFLGG
jgi:hypothetical protein